MRDKARFTAFFFRGEGGGRYAPTSTCRLAGSKVVVSSQTNGNVDQLYIDQLSMNGRSSRQ